MPIARELSIAAPQLTANFSSLQKKIVLSGWRFVELTKGVNLEPLYEFLLSASFPWHLVHPYSIMELVCNVSVTLLWFSFRC